MIIALIASAILVSQPAPPAIVGQASVIDGDTLEIRERRIRLWGVDAPESRQTCERPSGAWRCGQEAANRLAIWIGQSTVTCTPRGRPDRYRRVVARCSVQGIDVGGWLVSQGWALDYERHSEGTYARQEDDARRRRVGIHAGDFVEPWVFRRP